MTNFYQVLPNAAKQFYENKSHLFKRRLAMISTVSLFKIFSKWHNIQVVNGDRFLNAFENRKNQGLITVSNHDSLFDDHLLWTNLTPFKYFLNPDKIRWSLAASDVIYQSKMLTNFFLCGQTIPVWRTKVCRESGRITQRGLGIMQPEMDFVLDLLNNNKWVHIYPVGKIIYGFEKLRENKFKMRQGIGRLIYDSKTLPVVLPIWHCGIETMAPVEDPFSWNTIKLITRSSKATIYVGEPLELPSELFVKPSSENCVNRLQQIQQIVENIEISLYRLKHLAWESHYKFIQT